MYSCIEVVDKMAVAVTHMSVDEKRNALTLIGVYSTNDIDENQA